ncbi:MAG: ATP-grasp domain-containing protein [Bacteroidota bacterium]
MRIIYCDSVFDRKQVEPDYAKEKLAAEACKFKTSLISFELLEEGKIEDCLRLVQHQPETEKAMYRGWMLTPVLYKDLYNGLLNKNIQLINSPEEYQHTHYLPESYYLIESVTPKSVWTKDLTESSLQQLSSSIDSTSFIVKDFVKSEKHHWEEACFIPDSNDLENAMKVINRFIELRGEYLNAGIVLREFIELQPLTTHSESGMPLTKEFRMFFSKGTLQNVYPYWDEGEYGESLPETAVFEDIARAIQSNFFTMDVAQKTDGSWIIMELGDAQVSGLPDNADIAQFYQNLSKILQ